MREPDRERPAPRIKLRPFAPVTPKELERRRAVVAKILELRRKIGPVGITADELVHEARQESLGG